LSDKLFGKVLTHHDFRWKWCFRYNLDGNLCCV